MTAEPAAGVPTHQVTGPPSVALSSDGLKHAAEALAHGRGVEFTLDTGQDIALEPWQPEPGTALEEHTHQPDDEPKPAQRCKYCGRTIIWTGPNPIYDWELADNQD